MRIYRAMRGAHDMADGGREMPRLESKPAPSSEHNHGRASQASLYLPERQRLRLGRHDAVGGAVFDDLASDLHDLRGERIGMVD